MKADVEHLRESFQVSQRHACELMSVAVSTFRYRTLRSDTGLKGKLVELSRDRPRFGYRRLHVLLRREGETVNHKRVWRVYREAGLSVPGRKRKKLTRISCPLEPVLQANQEWAIDFAADSLASGRHIRIFSVVDAFTRECLAMGAGHKFRQPARDAGAGKGNE